MRDYGKVLSTFWTRGSGKALRGHQEAQLVALYLFTAQSANMVGLYYLAMPTLAHETGLSMQGASKGLRRASEVGIALYDEAAELVWVPEMARYQIGETVSARDNRHGAIVRELMAIGKHPFVRGFFEKYERSFNLEIPDWVKALPSPFQGASEPLRSQDQEQEQEQEQDQEQEKTNSSDRPTPGSGAPGGSTASEVDQLWDWFLEARAGAIGKSNEPKSTTKRRKQIQARLKTYSVAELRTAIGGLFASKFHIEHGHTTPEYVFRSDEQVEKCIGWASQETNGEVIGAAETRRRYLGPESPPPTTPPAERRNGGGWAGDLFAPPRKATTETTQPPAAAPEST